jgi:hypothetical protein
MSEAALRRGFTIVYTAPPIYSAVVWHHSRVHAPHTEEGGTGERAAAGYGDRAGLVVTGGGTQEVRTLLSPFPVALATIL